jgi:hypothetical protein
VGQTNVGRTLLSVALDFVLMNLRANPIHELCRTGLQATSTTKIKFNIEGDGQECPSHTTTGQEIGHAQHALKTPAAFQHIARLRQTRCEGWNLTNVNRLA